MEHLLRFLLKMCQRAVERDVEYYTSRYTTIAKLVRRQRQVYEVFRDNPERRIGLSTLLELTDIPRRTAIHALQQLVKNKLLQKNSRASSTHYQLIF
jgi:predicted transcriptional regulator